MPLFDDQAVRLEEAARLLANPSTDLAAQADPGLPLHLRERLQPAQEHAARAMARAEQLGRKTRTQHAVQFAALQRAVRSPGHLLLALQELADEVMAPVSGQAACKPGCSHCCHIPVAVSGREAELIGQRIGLKPLPVPDEQLTARTTWGYDHPCPFLSEERCSIYSHRPMACRWHFNLDVDALLCELLPDRTVPVPLADSRRFQVLYMRFSAGTPLADIRDFFPAERVSRRKRPRTNEK